MTLSVPKSWPGDRPSPWRSPWGNPVRLRGGARGVTLPASGVVPRGATLSAPWRPSWGDPVRARAAVVGKPCPRPGQTLAGATGKSGIRPVSLPVGRDIAGRRPVPSIRAPPDRRPARTGARGATLAVSPPPPACPRAASSSTRQGGRVPREPAAPDRPRAAAPSLREGRCVPREPEAGHASEHGPARSRHGSSAARARTVAGGGLAGRPEALPIRALSLRPHGGGARAPPSHTVREPARGRRDVVPCADGKHVLRDRIWWESARAAREASRGPRGRSRGHPARRAPQPGLGPPPGGTRAVRPPGPGRTVEGSPCPPPGRRRGVTLSASREPVEGFPRPGLLPLPRTAEGSPRPGCLPTARRALEPLRRRHPVRPTSPMQAIPPKDGRGVTPSRRSEDIRTRAVPRRGRTLPVADRGRPDRRCKDRSSRGNPALASPRAGAHPPSEPG